MSQPPSPETVRDGYAALPPDAQETIAALVALLGRQSQTRPKRRPARRVPLRDDPAIGQWRDRTDMADSVEYVRALRRKHWGGAQ